MLRSIFLIPFLVIPLTTFATQGETNNPNVKAISVPIKLVDATVAAVNGEPILLSDVKLYRLLFPHTSPKEALQRLIDIYTVAQYAQARGISIPPQKINEIVENFASSQGMTVDQLYKELEKAGLGGSVFTNFLEKYNLYIAAIQLFVLKPLHENKEKLELLIAERTKEVPLYELTILKIPKKVAEKYTDLLVSEDINKISQTLGIKPINLTVEAQALKPQIRETVKRLSPGQVDFAEDKNYLYVVKLNGIKYKHFGDKEKIIKQIEEEKIKEFVQRLEKEAVIKLLIKDNS